MMGRSIPTTTERASQHTRSGCFTGAHSCVVWMVRRCPLEIIGRCCSLGGGRGKKTTADGCPAGISGRRSSLEYHDAARWNIRALFAGIIRTPLVGGRRAWETKPARDTNDRQWRRACSRNLTPASLPSSSPSSAEIRFDCDGEATTEHNAPPPPGSRARASEREWDRVRRQDAVARSPTGIVRHASRTAIIRHHRDPSSPYANALSRGVVVDRRSSRGRGGIQSPLVRILSTQWFGWGYP